MTIPIGWDAPAELLDLMQATNVGSVSTLAVGGK